MNVLVLGHKSRAFKGIFCEFDHLLILMIHTFPANTGPTPKLQCGFTITNQEILITLLLLLGLSHKRLFFYTLFALC